MRIIKDFGIFEQESKGVQKSDLELFFKNVLELDKYISQISIFWNNNEFIDFNDEEYLLYDASEWSFRSLDEISMEDWLTPISNKYRTEIKWIPFEYPSEPDNKQEYTKSVCKTLMNFEKSAKKVSESYEKVKTLDLNLKGVDIPWEGTEMSKPDYPFSCTLDKLGEQIGGWVHTGLQKISLIAMEGDINNLFKEINK